MPAPQQSMIPTYKETANIRVPNTDYHRFDDRDSPGYALAKLLGALPDAAQTFKNVQDKQDKPGEIEQEQLTALAQMGAERDRLRLAKGGSVFGLLQDKEASLDAYELNRGRRDADLAAGALRDAYAASGLAESDDPKAFQAFVQQQQAAMFANLKDTDPSYYHGYITRVGGVFEEMSKAHAGNLDTFITHKNKRAFESRIDSKVAIELATNKEKDAFGNFMNNIMGAESGGNYNAFHGNGNNSNIRFTDMTLQEVLDFQSSGAWKRHGAGSSAVGKYQFIESTLRDTIRAAGLPLDTKFTPAVQDKLIFYRLVSTRGMKDYLDGKISAEQFLDNGLAKEFAGLKKTNGKGEYDGDGLNKATQSSRKTLAALIAFKEAYLQDPASVASKTDAKGKLILGAEDQVAERGVVDDLDNAESEYGIAGTEARKGAADALIKQMDANPAMAEREDIEDLMSRWKLPKGDRERVREAQTRLRAENQQKGDIAAQKDLQETVGLADKYIRSGDEEALQTIRSKSPQVYQRLLGLQTTPVDPSLVDNETFEQSANFGDPKFPQVAIRALMNGEIDRETYTASMEQFDTIQKAKPIVAMPGIKPFVDKLKVTLPGAELKSIFDAQLAIALGDLMEANGGKRPALAEIQAAATSTHQALQALGQQEVQARTSRPEYNLGKQE